jgi:hypothetical protein
MAASFEVDASGAFAKLDRIGPSVRQALLDELTPLAADMASDARARALAHFHSIGVKPGAYLASIAGGVSDKDSKVVGYVRSASPLAHLLELGFTIRDWIIVPGTGEGTKSYLGAIMAFAGAEGMRFALTVHRPETKVQAYPAIQPAFDAMRGEVEAALRRVKEKAGG